MLIVSPLRLRQKFSPQSQGRERSSLSPDAQGQGRQCSRAKVADSYPTHDVTNDQLGFYYSFSPFEGVKANTGSERRTVSAAECCERCESPGRAVAAKHRGADAGPC